MIFDEVVSVTEAVPLVGGHDYVPSHEVRLTLDPKSCGKVILLCIPPRPGLWRLFYW